MISFSVVRSLGVVLRVNQKIVSPPSCWKAVSVSSVTSDGKMSDTDCVRFQIRGGGRKSGSAGRREGVEERGGGG